jgi:hypothetical protein
MASDNANIFLSYSGDELPFVRAVADEMRIHGVETWFDQTEIAPGAEWRETHANALASSKAGS